jgi:hypothetical protein
VDFDSLVDLEHPLPVAWLQEQPGCHDLFRDAPYSGTPIPPQIVPLLNAYWERHVRQQEAAGFGVRLREGSDRMTGSGEDESVG